MVYWFLKNTEKLTHFAPKTINSGVEFSQIIFGVVENLCWFRIPHSKFLRGTYLGSTRRLFCCILLYFRAEKPPPPQKHQFWSWIFPNNFWCGWNFVLISNFMSEIFHRLLFWSYSTPIFQGENHPPQKTTNFVLRSSQKIAEELSAINFLIQETWSAQNFTQEKRFFWRIILQELVFFTYISLRSHNFTGGL